LDAVISNVPIVAIKSLDMPTDDTCEFHLFGNADMLVWKKHVKEEDWTAFVAGASVLPNLEWWLCPRISELEALSDSDLAT